MRAFLRALALAILIGALPAAPAHAWLAPGHMAAGALSYDALQVTDPAAVQAILRIMQDHPDRARFAARLQGLQGAAYDRKLFELMSRWPDDVRRTPYDHPKWHYSEQVQSRMRYILPFGFGFAQLAYHRELAIARDPHAPAADRAVALCWVLHVVQDVHEPLHTGMWMSRRFPLTDKGGTIAWVRTSPQTPPETLHWLWDSAGAVDPDEGRHRDPDAFAALIEVEHPLHVGEPPADPDAALTGWIKDSRLIARHVAYDDGAVPLGATLETASVLPAAYVAQVQAVAKAQLVLSAEHAAEVLHAMR